MSWSAKGYVGPANDYAFELETDESALNERQRRIALIVGFAVEDIVWEIGGERVGVSAGGHAGDELGPGDSVSISITSLFPEATG